MLEELKATTMDSGAIALCAPAKAAGPWPRGFWCARRLLSNEPFAVILPDDVIAAETPCLQQMVEAHAETGGNMVAAMEVPADKTSAYGVLDIKEDIGIGRIGEGEWSKKTARRVRAVESGGDRALTS